MNYNDFLPIFHSYKEKLEKLKSKRDYKKDCIAYLNGQLEEIKLQFSNKQVSSLKSELKTLKEQNIKITHELEISSKAITQALKYYCPKCSQTFNEEVVLRSHISSHSNKF